MPFPVKMSTIARTLSNIRKFSGVSCHQKDLQIIRSWSHLGDIDTTSERPARLIYQRLEQKRIFLAWQRITHAWDWQGFSRGLHGDLPNTKNEMIDHNRPRERWISRFTHGVLNQGLPSCLPADPGPAPRADIRSFPRKTRLTV
jgi:hypothetical protein